MEKPNIVGLFTLRGSETGANYIVGKIDQWNIPLNVRLYQRKGDWRWRFLADNYNRRDNTIEPNFYDLYSVAGEPMAKLIELITGMYSNEVFFMEKLADEARRIG